MRISALTSLLALAGCSAPTVESEFAELIAPILQSRCAAATCHGVAAAEDRRGLDLHPDKYLTFELDSQGGLRDLDAALRSVKAKVDSTEDVEFSSLLRKPLPLAQGGLLHFQKNVFDSRADPEWRALRAWAGRVQDGSEHAEVPPLNELEQRFAEVVYPTLVRKGCTVVTCHGELNFGGAVLKPPAIPGTTRLPRATLRANYQEALRNLAPLGDPLHSRLFAKFLPLEAGGLPHKGGNDVFMAIAAEDKRDPRLDPELRQLLDWASAVQAQALSEVGSVAPTSSVTPSIIYVGGPLAPAGPFSQAPFTPGTDLYRLDAPWAPGTAANITAAYHSSPADIRDPAISHDGRRVVFSMRRSADDAANIYSLGVDGADLRQLTFDRADQAGGFINANTSPVYGPTDGTHYERSQSRERIYFVSTRGRGLTDRSDIQDSDLYAIDLDGSHLERLTFTPAAEVSPTFLATGEFSGTVVYTIQRAVTGGFRGALFRFPIDHNPEHHLQPEAHPHFGTVGVNQVYYGLRELVNGRGVLTLLDEGNQWRGGQLAILDRQLAVDTPAGLDLPTTVPAFRHALSVLTPGVGRRGESAEGLWRDPAPLPDGSFLVIHAEGPLDLDDPTTPPRGALLRVRLGEDRQQLRPRISQVDLVLPSQLEVSQPAVVAPRPFEDALHPRAFGDGDAPAVLVHSGTQVVEALLSKLPPLGARELRVDLAALRVLAPVTPLHVTPVRAQDTRSHRPGATSASLLGRAPLYAVAEVPLASDGSCVLELPARHPLRLSTLDAEKMARGSPHHHWSAPQSEERFPVGIATFAYAARCGGCHGAMDGKPEHVLMPPVDLITQASVSASRFAAQDRRRPLPPARASPVYVDFRRDLGPILSEKCAREGCHAGGAPAAQLSLTAEPTQAYTDAYESLLRSSDGAFLYVDAVGQRARASALMERLLGRELEAQAPLLGTCPPAGSPPLTAEELLTFTRWIELGAAYVGLPEVLP